MPSARCPPPAVRTPYPLTCLMKLWFPKGNTLWWGFGGNAPAYIAAACIGRCACRPPPGSRAFLTPPDLSDEATISKGSWGATPLNSANRVGIVLQMTDEFQTLCGFGVYEMDVIGGAAWGIGGEEDDRGRADRPDAMYDIAQEGYHLARL